MIGTYLKLNKSKKNDVKKERNVTLITVRTNSEH